MSNEKEWLVSAIPFFFTDKKSYLFALSNIFTIFTALIIKITYGIQIHYYI